MRIALLSLALLAPTVASAGVGVGTTIGMGPQQIDINFNGTAVPSLTAGGFRPSLDLHFDTFRLQIHALETLDQLFDEEIFLGVNGYIEVVQSPVSGGLDAVFAPGAGIDLLGDPFTLALTGEAQVGIRTRGASGIGVFIVPAVGVGVGDGNSDLIATGTLQVSCWFGGGSSNTVNNTAPTL
ncbi:MAG: hypothetical protein EP330_03165 [Deltaproteobacteria bacterium]|nr:MAG: hypothetical protein EP330_03165 [Deltaproteobacteria bacterium]